MNTCEKYIIERLQGKPYYRNGVLDGYIVNNQLIHRSMYEHRKRLTPKYKRMLLVFLQDK